jgi:predicted DNA-binding protein
MEVASTKGYKFCPKELSNRLLSLESTVSHETSTLVAEPVEDDVEEEEEAP